MKKSKSELRHAVHKIPVLRFEDQCLTSFSGLVLFQRLFEVLELKRRLKASVRHLSSSASYGLHTIIFVLVLHLILGWRRIRDLDYYRDDPMVLRTLGLSKMPHVSTVTRALRQMDHRVVERIGDVNWKLVWERVQHERLATLTIDFDGSLQSTKSRTTEGTAVGYNPKAKGQRSYYPLFATIAQTGQVLRVLHRPGNVHDSNGAAGFVKEVFLDLRAGGYRGRLEARMDSAHFNDSTCLFLDDQGVEFSVSVPFERVPALKTMIKTRERWQRIDDDWSFFEPEWKPKKWKRSFRCIVYRHRVKTPRKGPIQLNLFAPVDRQFEYKVVLTNKDVSAAALLGFHNGRGSQEGLFAELKSQTQMDYIPTRRLVGNQVYLLSAVLAHNLNRELQMRISKPQRRNTLTRACLWLFERTGTFRKRLVQRAGRLTRPLGNLTLTLAANQATATELQQSLHSIKAA